MGSRGSNHRLSSSASSFGSRISFVMLSMFATMASFYVAGRLWQDAENRVYLINELDKRTGQEQQKKLAALHVDLEKARQEGFVPKHLPENGGALKKLEEEKGIVIRFVIGRSTNQGDSSDREIDSENMQANDFTILENHMETPAERANKTKLFLIHAVEHWDAEFYAKINDDVYVNIDALGSVLASHLDKPRVYIGCMKSGEVFSQPKHKWYEPDWWKFGDGKSLVLRTYAHDDVSVGSWFIGLDVKHVDEGKFCCSSWSSGSFLIAL
ncbi:hypothetical protein DH2020_036283 [Rehmannia glutinosa]|uniref:Hexosyltransferase n=1 Tax=Rehmannia glutinosa TaxID=99300 RepID=A0ABR0V7C2_REHGL